MRTMADGNETEKHEDALFTMDLI